MRCIFTNRTIGMTSFSIGTNRTIGTNGPSVWRIVSVCVYWTCVFKNGFCVFGGKSKTDHEPIKSTPWEDFSDQIQIWIFDIHNLSGFFLGKDLKKVFFTSGFPNKNGAQQMLYDILTDPMLVRRLNLSHLVHFIPCLSSIYICRLLLNPYLSCFLYVCSVCLRRFIFQVIKKKFIGFSFNFL